MKPYEYYKEIEVPCARIFAQMSDRGVCVDLNYISQLKTELEKQFKPVEQKIKDKLGIANVNSNKQVVEALDNRYGLKFYLKGKPSRSKKCLERIIGNEIVDLLLLHSELGTLLNNFVYKYLERDESIVHCFFNQCGTRTGRLSCSNPNLLQIPKHTENGNLVRKMFIPRPGMSLGDCDFGQIEPRVLAHLSKDPVMCQMFNDGIDFHSFTAERVKRIQGNRDKAKVLNLSVGYIATPASVSEQLKCSWEEAENVIEEWWALFPQLRRWEEKLIWESTRSGFCTTLLGRRIKIDGLDDISFYTKNGRKIFAKRDAARRQLINNITQGSAAEIMKLAMIKINQTPEILSACFGMLVQVYDELLFESDDIMEDKWNVKYAMETAYPLDVPLVVDCKTGPNWGEVN